MRIKPGGKPIKNLRVGIPNPSSRDRHGPKEGGLGGGQETHGPARNRPVRLNTTLWRHPNPEKLGNGEKDRHPAVTPVVELLGVLLACHVEAKKDVRVNAEGEIVVEWSGGRLDRPEHAVTTNIATMHTEKCKKRAGIFPEGKIQTQNKINWSKHKSSLLIKLSRSVNKTRNLHQESRNQKLHV